MHVRITQHSEIRNSAQKPDAAHHKRIQFHIDYQVNTLLAKPTFSMARFRESVSRERHVGHSGSLGLQLTQTRWPRRHWWMGGAMYSMHTGHSSRPIKPWFSVSSSKLGRGFGSRVGGSSSTGPASTDSDCTCTIVASG